MKWSDEEVKQISAELESKHPADILAWVDRTFGPERVTMATGFGAEGVVLIDMLSSVNRNIPIFYLDTDVLFPETYDLRQKLESYYEIRFYRYASAYSMDDQTEHYGPRLWERDPDRCCSIRKLEPLKRALEGRSAWITSIRRDQSEYRRTCGILERDIRFGLLKINPLATWTRGEVWEYIRVRGIPFNPLYDRGYTSIGCTHCTSPVAENEDERAGRWRGFEKKECGLHRIEVTVNQ